MTVISKTTNRIRATDMPRLVKTQGKHNDGGSLFLTVIGGSARWQYDYKDGEKTRSLYLGSAVGLAAVSLADARQARNQAWLDRRANGAPRQAHRKAAGTLFTEALQGWLRANASKWAERSVKARGTLAELSLASLDIGKITQSDVLAALSNETPRQHTDKRGWLRDLFAFAKVQGWRTGDNPCDFDADTRRGFAKVEKGEEHHAAVRWEEMPAVYAALPDDVAGNAVRFQTLAAARPGAVEAATWSQIVGENGGTTWQYTILKGNKPFQQRVPLTAETLALIGERGADDALLFSLKRNAMLNAIKAVREGVTAAGLRSTFKQWCDDNTADDKLSEAALGHYHGDSVHRAYSRGDLFGRRRDLMQKWAAFVTAPARGAARCPGLLFG